MLCLRFELKLRNESLSSRFHSTIDLMKEFISNGGGKSTRIAKALDKYKLALKSIVNLVFTTLNQPGHVIGSTKFVLINVPKVSVFLNII